MGIQVLDGEDIVEVVAVGGQHIGEFEIRVHVGVVRDRGGAAKGGGDAERDEKFAPAVVGMRDVVFDGGLGISVTEIPIPSESFTQIGPADISKVDELNGSAL